MKKSNVILFVFSVTIVFVSQVLAADFHVSTRNQLKEALSMSAGNKDAKDTIYLAAGIYTGDYRLDGIRLIEDEENELIIIGEDGTTAEQIIFDGEDISNIFYFDFNNSNIKVVIKGITFQRVNLNAYESCAIYIAISDGKIEIKNCIIKNNRGGILVSCPRSLE